MTDETMRTAEGRVDVAEPTVALLREALDETRDLVRLEVELARVELKAELTRAMAAGVALGAAGALSIAGFAMFMVAIATAFSMTWLAALLIGVVLALLAGAAGLAGWKALPRKPLGETKERLESDLKQLKERIA
jgi:uncharacterized membrane protein YqjE